MSPKRSAESGSGVVAISLWRSIISSKGMIAAEGQARLHWASQSHLHPDPGRHRCLGLHPAAVGALTLMVAPTIGQRAPPQASHPRLASRGLPPMTTLEQFGTVKTD